eukprot:CAMPEP_0197024772 /NCGR_PEP_ID=MMETSP1384-20130603/5270_1 /TAXON_ID=29189 /ORGANISM="Ammonia sp." /LENGTH=134 /DNA_ID=CAMNT_0042453217 /DNA_START=89 /DNA_END=493 /DNA_ORIENTATION=-
MGCCGSSERFALKVEVIKASGLPDVDIRGKCDPFVEVTVDGCDPQKTETKKNEQEPVWNQTMLFEDVRLGKNVRFKVYDWDRLTSNDFIGGHELGQALPDKYNEEKEFDFDLIKDGDVSGRLWVKITFIHEKPE